MADQKVDLEVVVTCADETPTVGLPHFVTGWGEEGSETTVEGQVKEIRVDRNGEAQFGIQILDDGQIILTDYGHMCFKTAVPRNLRFVPTRPWKPNQ